MDPCKTFRAWNPGEYVHQAVAPADVLPEDDLVFFLLETVSRLDLSTLYSHYEREMRGAPPFDVAMMVTLLLYSYAVGVFSSRKIAAACERNLAFLAIVGADRPDFRTISDFRKIHLDSLADLFVQVLQIAGMAGLVKLGNIAIDGSKFKANASRHQAMSYGYMQKEVVRLRAEIAALLGRAEKTDAEQDAALGSRRGDELPEELKRREDRLTVIEEAMQRLEQQAREKADAERERRAAADAEREAKGETRRGREPAPVSDEPADKAQTNFTDPEAKIMKNGKAFDYCYNAQAAVDDEHQIIVGAEVTSQANDKQQAVPLAEAVLENLAAAGIDLPTEDDAPDGPPKKIPATLDSGYFSADNVTDLEDLGFDPHIATGRQKHNTPAPSETDDSPPESATAKERMAHKLKTPKGRACYAKRKHIVEPVFGQMKHVRGFRQFLLRGLDNVAGEWKLVCLTHNLLKIWRSQYALS
jgi:transposase